MGLCYRNATNSCLFFSHSGVTINKKNLPKWRVLIVRAYFSFVGVATAFAGSSKYIFDTIRGKTKPNRVTWLIWAIAPVIATAVALSDGVGWAILPAFMSGFCPFLIFLASFFNKNSYWRLSGLDYACGALAVASLVFFAVSRDTVLTIILTILVDTFAAIPTLIKSYKYPETESGLFYAIGMLTQATGFIAMQTWSFSEYAFGIFVFALNAVLAVLIYANRFLPGRRGSAI